MTMTPEAIVANVFGHDRSEIDDATSPDSLPEWDSLGHITLIIELEAAFGVSFAPEETMAMTDVGAIKKALQARGTEW
jgi:acyl carrier protein